MSIPNNAFKAVETGSDGFIETPVRKGINQLDGSRLKFTKADRTDLNNRPYGHLFVSFNLPVTLDEKAVYLSGGTLYNTSFAGFNVDKIIVAEIPQNEYGELVDGKTIELDIPLFNGTGTTAVTCYSSFFNGGFVNASNADSLLSDGNPEVTLYGSTPSNDNGNNSNVAYLFSNQIAPPVTSGKTWSNTGKFKDGSRVLAQYNGTSYDTPVGIAYLDKGFLVLTHPTIVNNFKYSDTTARSSGYDGITSGSTYTGGSNFTQIYFTSAGVAKARFDSITTEFIQNIICLALPNEFFTTNNPTFAEAYGTDPALTADNPVYITEIGLYNSNKELIAIAKPSEPILKDRTNITTFNIQLKV